MLIRTWTWMVILSLAAMLNSGCAVLSEKNRYLTRFLDEELTPESSTTKAVMAPVAIPVGFTALAIDGVIINPLVVLPEAFEDASQVFTEVEFMGPLEIIVFPMRLVTFPVILVGSEIFRCTFPGL